MAKVLGRREMLHDQDLLAWAEQQAEHLRAGQLDRLDLEQENPSLRSELEPAARAAYPQARKRAAIETGLPRAAFPGDLPYDLGHIMGEEGDPDGP